MTNNSHLGCSGKLRYLAQHLDRFQLFLFAFFVVHVKGLYHGRDWISVDANAIVKEQVKYLCVPASHSHIHGKILVLLVTIACEDQSYVTEEISTLPCH